MKSGNLIVWDRDPEPVVWVYLRCNGKHFALATAFGLELSELTDQQVGEARKIGRLSPTLTQHALEYAEKKIAYQESAFKLSDQMRADPTIQRLRYDRSETTY